MLINTENLQGLRTAFRMQFQNAFDGAESTWDKIAMLVPSTTRENAYPFLGRIKGMTEWIGQRQIQNLAQHDFTIKNRSFENTVAVDRDDISDDQVGIYNPMFQDMGQTTKEWPDDLVWPLLQAGETTTCYDGQNFFDTDHPVIDANGQEQSVSNHMGGAGDAWYLLSTNRPIKPIIFQQRKKPQFVALDNPEDDRVFHNKEFVYGVDSRGNVGFGLWQMGLISKQDLTSANLNAAIAHMMGMTGDNGRPLKIMPNLLVVKPSMREAALEITKAERLANGATNINRNLVDVHIEPRLAA